jgi:hypothetical protein
MHLERETLVVVRCDAAFGALGAFVASPHTFAGVDMPEEQAEARGHTIPKAIGD